MNVLCNKIKEELSKNIPKLWVDVYAKQFERNNENQPLLFPAVFVEFGEIDYNQQLSDSATRTGLLKGTLWVAQDIYSATYDTAGVQNIDYFALLEDVELCIYRLSETSENASFNPIKILTVQYDDSITSYLVHKILFSTQITKSNKRVFKYAPEPQIQPNIII